ncbi:MAG: glutamyl-tRNA reductase [Gemmatimonadales bacterium]
MGTRIAALVAPLYRSHVPPELSFHVVGVSHHTVGLKVREQLAFAPADRSVWLEQQRRAGRAALMLSTCNRFELYWTGDHDYEAWFRELALSRGVDHDGAVTRLDGVEAVRHLFQVAAGLDSQILGETEILGQVRRAFDTARAAGTTTRELDAVFSAALAAGRRVRQETSLGRHPSSVSSAAVDLAARRYNGIEDRPILVLGAGEVAEGVLRRLHEHRATRVTLVSRNPDRARPLAAAWGADIRLWTELDALLAAADLVLVATAASRPLLSALQLAEGMTARGGRGLMVMDLAVPRNVEPAARAIPGIQLLDLEDLQRLCCPVAGTASAAPAGAERVLGEEIARLDLCFRGRAAAPRLTELHRLGAQMAEQETAWALAQLEELSERERQVVREMADRLVRRVLYPVSRSVREDGRPEGR